MNVLPEVLLLAKEVLSEEKFQEANDVAQTLLSNKKDRKWATQKQSSKSD